MTTRLEREMSAIACIRPMPVSTSVAKIGPSRRTTCDSCWYATNLKRLPALQKSQLEWLLAIFQLSIRIFWRNFTRYSDIISDIVDPSPYVLETGRKIVFLFRDVSKLKEQWSRQAKTISNVTSLDFCGLHRFVMKLFRSVNTDVINERRLYSNFLLQSEMIENRRAEFERQFCKP